MSVAFDPASGPIVEASLSGPAGHADLRLILDTGATISLIRSTILVAVGYDPDASADRLRVATGGGVASVPRVVLNRFSALGRHRPGSPVLSHAICRRRGSTASSGSTSSAAPS